MRHNPLYKCGIFILTLPHVSAAPICSKGAPPEWPTPLSRPPARAIVRCSWRPQDPSSQDQSIAEEPTKQWRPRSAAEGVHHAGCSACRRTATAVGIKDETDALPALTAYLRWQWLYSVVRYKRLEKAQFCWPRIGHNRVQLNHAQLMALVDGMDWKRVRSVAVKPPEIVG
ncbi:IS66 family insertion sequence transposase domain-containing protein [Rhizobium phaseoli Brasil 5]|nr:IS66 family insertion sequence transposase domain-containing protein [Rhizobium phaseoli Brasil 5]